MTSLEKAQADGVLIGLAAAGAGTKKRLEIDDMVATQPDTFNLFLLALESLQTDPEKMQDKMGYFQIAGPSSLTLYATMLGEVLADMIQAFTACLTTVSYTHLTLPTKRIV